MQLRQPLGGSMTLGKEGVMEITVTLDIVPEFVIAVIVTLFFRKQ
jgi:hypothetical protein